MVMPLWPAHRRRVPEVSESESACARAASEMNVEFATIEAILSARLTAESSRSSISVDDDEDLAAILHALHGRYGTAIKAVLLYGSYTRGARDSLVDLYVLLDVYPPVVPRWQALANKILPPNVYQLEAETGVRCKYALMPLRQFARCLDRDFHSYFWARFAQPCQLVYLSDGVTQASLIAGLAAGTRRFLTESSLALESDATAHDLFREGLSLTYGCELRAESQLRAAELVTANSDYFAALGNAWLREQETGSGRGLTPGGLRWPLRKALGKVLSVLRLMKAAATFNDGFEYLLWKIERHSGIYIEPTPAQRKLPLLLGWPLFWRLYRLGAFK